MKNDYANLMPLPTELGVQGERIFL